MSKNNLTEIKGLYNEKVKDNQFSKNDKSDLLTFYKKLNDKNKINFKEFISKKTTTLKYSNNEYIEFLELIENSVSNLKVETKKNNIKWGFNEIKETVSENNEAMKEFMETIWEYIEYQLDSSFSGPQKDKIKLVLTYSLVKKIENFNPTTNVITWIFSKLKKSVKWILVKNTEEVKNIKSEFSKSFHVLWIEEFWEEFNKKIEKINTAKINETKNNKNSFSKLWEIWKIISEKGKNIFEWKAEDTILENMKTDISKFWKKLKWFRWTWDKFLKNLDEQEVAWINLWESFRSFISEGIKEWWFMWMVLWFISKLFFGSKEFSESNEKSKKSTENLKKYINTNKKDWVLKKLNFYESDVSRLENKSLGKFYKFLDWKKIDYTKDNFWENLFSEKDNSEGKDLKLIKWILAEKLSNEKAYWDSTIKLIEILNSTHDIFIKKENKNNINKIEKNQKRIAYLKSKQEWTKEEDVKKPETEKTEIKKTEVSKTKKEDTTKVATEKTKVKTDKKSKPEEVKTEEVKNEEVKNELTKEEEVAELKKLEEETNKLYFENSINNLSIPWYIINPENWERLEIKIDWENIKLWDKNYKISIIADIPLKWKTEKFKKVEFIDWNIILNWNKENPVNKNQIKELIIKLLNWEEFNYKWIKKWMINVEYELNIKKEN